MMNPSSRSLAGLSGWFVLSALLAPNPVCGQQWDLTLDAVEHSDFSGRSIRLHVDPAQNGSAQLQIGKLRIGRKRFSQVTVRCAPLRWDGSLVDCPHGRLRASGRKTPIPVSFRLVPATGNLQMALLPAPRERWGLALDVERGKRRVRLDVANGALERVVSWVPRLAGVRAKGELAATATWTAPGSGRDQVQAQWRVSDGAFSDRAGTHAADKIGASGTLSAWRQADQWRWQSAFDWSRGEAFWAPWYVRGGGFETTLAGTLDSRSLAVTEGEALLRDVGSLAFEAKLRLPDGRIEHARFHSEPFRLDRIAPLAIAPVLEQSGAPQIDFSGELQLAGEIVSGRVVGLDANLSRVGLDEAGGEFGISGVSGRLAWRTDAPTAGSLKVESARYGRLHSGSFGIPFRTEGSWFSIPRLAVPLLDGRVLVNDLEAKRLNGGWSWQFVGAVEPISMERLTSALGLPRMAGSLSASIPAVSYADETLAMDGALVIQVFDGFVSATDLRLVEPLGRVPRLQATLEARHLHLGQLTQTFSFGSVSGYVDAYIKDLELANWRPQRFDGLVITSPGSFPKRISQRAVQNISALGGAGPVAALQRSFLGVFKEFRYATLGLSCSLRGGVCEMGGVEPAGDGYVIVKGGGIPSITVIGYNRRVDWDELLARVQRVTSANSAPVVQ